MEYQGYVGTIWYDRETRRYAGRVAGIHDPVVYEGASPAAVETDFRAAVDAYLARCAADGRAPEPQFSGRFLLRTSPEVHRAAGLAAAAEGKTLNAWAAAAIARAAGVAQEPTRGPRGSGSRDRERDADAARALTRPVR